MFYLTKVYFFMMLVSKSKREKGNFSLTSRYDYFCVFACSLFLTLKQNYLLLNKKEWKKEWFGGWLFTLRWLRISCRWLAVRITDILKIQIFLKIIKSKNIQIFSKKRNLFIINFDFRRETFFKLFFLNALTHLSIFKYFQKD